jgi:hypothetical protein
LTPVLLISVIYFFRGLRMLDMKSHQERIEQKQSQARAEQALFQEVLLGELKRHNAAMERPAESLARILERLGRDEPT